MENDKEKFLSSIENEENKNSYIRKSSISSLMSIGTLKKNEIHGIILSCLAYFCVAFGVFYTKLVQKTYPNDFHSIQFLFLRSFCILLLSIITSYITKKQILKLSEIKIKFWFFIRTNFNFLGVASMTICLWYLRASTAQIIATLSPIIIFILSYFFLNEKFYMRYFYGCIICLIGSFIIILNEKNSKNIKNEKSNFNDILIGVFFCFLNVIATSLISVANKKLADNKVPISTQGFYVGLTTCFYSSIFSFFYGNICLKIGYLIMCMIHGLFFYGFLVLFNSACKLCQLSKLALTSYLQIVYIFILGSFFLKEEIFFTDIIGSFFIVGFMIYNTMNPLPVK
jgi:drug/metabolite transporter (DMT)-like permease